MLIFREIWIEQIEKHQSNLIPTNIIRDNKQWFEYLFNEIDPKKSTYRCRLCFEHYDKFSLEKRYKNSLAYKEGTLKSDKSENMKTIRDHANTPGHKTIIQILEQQSAKKLRTDFENIQERENEALGGKLRVTSAMFRTVFIEIKRNIPFDSHTSLVSLQQINGINMGYHHFDRYGATKMMESMSSYMHRLLINHMLAKESPFSIIIDGSTDITDTHFLIVYFQLLENNVPITCFYKLLETSSDVTANGFFKTIWDGLKNEERDFFNYFKRNLIGFASDGESVMSGVRGGLISFIRGISKQPIYAIHCMAHRIHLAIKKAYKTIRLIHIFT